MDDHRFNQNLNVLKHNALVDKNTIGRIFKNQFGFTQDITVRAPGRINLIGEHTDYNGGFVLPAAIDKAIWMAASRRNDGRFAFFAADLGELFLSESDATVFQTEKSWANYLLGVISEARKDGISIGGLTLAFGSDIPMGAGLSSSAALESGVLFLINELYALGLSKMEIVQLAQRGENEFVGMKCGIMDMFASVFGKENSVVRLDCQNLEFEYFPFEDSDYSLVLCDSGVKHALVESEYNTRRKESEEGVQFLKKFNPHLTSLREVSYELLMEHEHELRPVVFRRCKYVVEEIMRVEQACLALQANDLEDLGNLMFQTHEGLQFEYEVSCPEMDFLVATARANPTVLGARMMGGGFGGCTLNLIETTAIRAFSSEIQAAYQDAYGIALKIYPVRLVNGTEIC